MPASGSINVDRTRTVVVLPAPFGPRSPRTEPAGASKDTSLSAWTSPKRFASPRTLTPNSSSIRLLKLSIPYIFLRRIAEVVKQ